MLIAPLSAVPFGGSLCLGAPFAFVLGLLCDPLLAVVLGVLGFSFVVL